MEDLLELSLAKDKFQYSQSSILHDPSSTPIPIIIFSPLRILVAEPARKAPISHTQPHTQLSFVSVIPENLSHQPRHTLQTHHNGSCSPKMRSTAPARPRSSTCSFTGLFARFARSLHESTCTAADISWYIFQKYFDTALF